MLSIALRAADTVRTGNSKEWLISRLNNIFGSNIRNPQNETGNRKEIQGIRREYGRCWRHDQVGATLTLSLSVNICQYRLSVPSVSTVCQYRLSVPYVSTVCQYRLSVPLGHEHQAGYCWCPCRQSDAVCYRTPLQCQKDNGGRVHLNFGMSVTCLYCSHTAVVLARQGLNCETIFLNFI